MFKFINLNSIIRTNKKVNIEYNSNKEYNTIYSYNKFKEPNSINRFNNEYSYNYYNHYYKKFYGNIIRKSYSNNSKDGLESNKKRPSPWLLLIFPIIAFALGTWQIKRKEEKEKLIQELTDTLQTPAVELTPDIINNLPNMPYRKIIAHGIFLHEYALQVHKNYESTNGSLIVTPFVLKDGTILLVNRGFVPATLSHFNISGNTNDITIEGLIRKQETANSFTPPSLPKKRLFFFMDIPAMISTLPDSEKIIPVVIDLSVSGASGYPKAGTTNYEIPNNHLSYAITWFTLSVLLLAMTIKFNRK